MTTFNTGREAEEKAAQYLKERGFKIISQNWRTRFCEIDVIAQKDNTVYFVEVKYRQNSQQGSGLDYITRKKQQQMTFAALMWVSEREWDGDYCLSAVEVSGDDFEITNFIDSI